jgi:TPR repeat protein
MDRVFQLMRMQHQTIADLQLITLIRMMNYGLCLANGQGVSADVIEAEKCFILSANRKDSSARFLLGLCCYLESDVAST